MRVTVEQDSGGGEGGITYSTRRDLRCYAGEILRLSEGGEDGGESESGGTHHACGIVDEMFVVVCVKQ